MTWKTDGLWKTRKDHEIEGLFYHESVLKSYQTLRKAALNIDIINMEQSLDSYKLVVAPMLYIFRAGIEIKLRTFVENGGILIMTYWSGIVNETDLCYLEGTPHGLLDVLGLRSKEIDGLYEWEENLLIPVTENSLQLNTSYKCKNLCDSIEEYDPQTNEWREVGKLNFE